MEKEKIDLQLKIEEAKEESYSSIAQISQLKHRVNSLRIRKKNYVDKNPSIAALLPPITNLNQTSRPKEVLALELEEMGFEPVIIRNVIDYLGIVDAHEVVPYLEKNMQNLLLHTFQPPAKGKKMKDVQFLEVEDQAKNQSKCQICKQPQEMHAENDSRYIMKKNIRSQSFRSLSIAQGEQSTQNQEDQIKDNKSFLSNTLHVQMKISFHSDKSNIENPEIVKELSDYVDAKEEETNNFVKQEQNSQELLKIINQEQQNPPIEVVVVNTKQNENNKIQILKKDNSKSKPPKKLSYDPRIENNEMYKTQAKQDKLKLKVNVRHTPKNNQGDQNFELKVSRENTQQHSEIFFTPMMQSSNTFVSFLNDSIQSHISNLLNNEEEQEESKNNEIEIQNTSSHNSQKSDQQQKNDLDNAQTYRIQLSQSQIKIKIEDLECEICYQQQQALNFHEFDCSHRFCKQCVQNYFKENIKTNQLVMNCPQKDCSNKLEEQCILSMLDQN